MCHSLFNQSSVLGRVGSFPNFVIKNKATMNNFVHIYFCIVGSVSLV